MTYRVEMTDQAKAEAEEAYLYIAGDSLERANRWFNGLERAIDSLSMFPARCKLAMDVDEFGREIRKLLYGRYRILFTITGDTVLVLHVRHGARRFLGEVERDEERIALAFRARRLPPARAHRSNTHHADTEARRRQRVRDGECERWREGQSMPFLSIAPSLLPSVFAPLPTR